MIAVLVGGMGCVLLAEVLVAWLEGRQDGVTTASGLVLAACLLAVAGLAWVNR